MDVANLSGFQYLEVWHIPFCFLGICPSLSFSEVRKISPIFYCREMVVFIRPAQARSVRGCFPRLLCQ